MGDASAAVGLPVVSGSDRGERDVATAESVDDPGIRSGELTDSPDKSSNGPVLISGSQDAMHPAGTPKNHHDADTYMVVDAPTASGLERGERDVDTCADVDEPGVETGGLEGKEAGLGSEGKASSTWNRVRFETLLPQVLKPAHLRLCSEPLPSRPDRNAHVATGSANDSAHCAESPLSKKLRKGAPAAAEALATTVKRAEDSDADDAGTTAALGHEFRHRAGEICAEESIMESGGRHL
ncbi:hypothetical protein B0H11DRAFT_2036201 [Mycena galericulata]|nr:hypothetical protein B0H11DRAFT_2036201 [Mycena galericulata]